MQSLKTFFLLKSKISQNHYKALIKYLYYTIYIPSTLSDIRIRTVNNNFSGTQNMKKKKNHKKQSFFFSLYINIFSVSTAFLFKSFFLRISEFATPSEEIEAFPVTSFVSNIYVFSYIYILCNLQLLHKTTLVFWRKLKGGCTPICFMWIRDVFDKATKKYFFEMRYCGIFFLSYFLYIFFYL